MSFTQITFLFAFLPMGVLIYLVTYKLMSQNTLVCNIVLVCESMLFFWWAEPKLLLWFVLLTLVMYLLGKRIRATEERFYRRLVTICALVLFALLPVLYRYLPSLRFLTEDGTLAALPVFSDAIVPLGISFFALEAISYIVDIYSGKADAGGIFDSLAYMLMFPKAACGPVVLWRDIEPQLKTRKTNLNKISEGLKRIIIGYAKKAIIADTFASSIALIDAKMTTNSTDSLTVWLLGLMYFFRIYYDFSGYSDIAIGLCKIFGFDIGENFDSPYLSSSLTDFWRRWHVSLYTWFKEYIYIPLGGNKTGRTFFNILITFLLAGLWHGWRMTILIWALLNGIIVITEKVLSTTGWYQRIPLFIKVIFTMLLVILGWLLFRSPDIATAGSTFKALFISPGGEIPNFTWRFFMTRRTTVFLLIAAAGVLGLFDRISRLIRTKIGENAYEIFEKTMLLALFALSIMFVIATDYTPFIFAELQ